MRGLGRLAAVVLAMSVVFGLLGCGGPLEDEGPGGPVAGDGADLDASVSAACGKDTWKSYAAPFFKARCAGCHGSAFSTRAKVTSSPAQATLASGSMPQGKALSAAEKKRALAWFACGAP